MTSRDDGFSLGHCRAVHETINALIVAVETDEGRAAVDGDDSRRDDGTTVTIMVPCAMIHDNSDVYAKGHVGELIVVRWLAQQRGWTED